MNKHLLFLWLLMFGAGGIGIYLVYQGKYIISMYFIILASFLSGALTVLEMLRIRTKMRKELEQK